MVLDEERIRAIVRDEMERINQERLTPLEEMAKKTVARRARALHRRIETKKAFNVDTYEDERYLEYLQSLPWTIDDLERFSLPWKVKSSPSQTSSV